MGLFRYTARCEHPYSELSFCDLTRRLGLTGARNHSWRSLRGPRFNSTFIAVWLKYWKSWHAFSYTKWKLIVGFWGLKWKRQCVRQVNCQKVMSFLCWSPRREAGRSVGLHVSRACHFKRSLYLQFPLVCLKWEFLHYEEHCTWGGGWGVCLTKSLERVIRKARLWLKFTAQHPKLRCKQTQSVWLTSIKMVFDEGGKWKDEEALRWLCFLFENIFGSKSDFFFLSNEQVDKFSLKFCSKKNHC